MFILIECQNAVTEPSLISVLESGYGPLPSFHVFSYIIYSMGQEIVVKLVSPEKVLEKYYSVRM